MAQKHREEKERTKDGANSKDAKGDDLYEKTRDEDCLGYGVDLDVVRRVQLSCGAGAVKTVSSRA